MLIFRGLTVFFCISASVSSKKRFEDLLGISEGLEPVEYDHISHPDTTSDFLRETFRCSKQRVEHTRQLHAFLMGILGKQKKQHKKTPSPKSFRFRHHMWREKICQGKCGGFLWNHFRR